MTTDLPDHADVVIIGAGPAGLAAAAELRALGVAQVLVLERAREAGGVPRICGHSPYGLREFGRPMFGPRYADMLRDRAIAAGARVITGAVVTQILDGPKVQVSTDQSGATTLGARAILLATGTRETPRTGRLIGGVKPGGVMVTGALQHMVYGARLRPFTRPLILGTELVAFSALLTCRHAGIRPAAMVEPNSRIVTRHPSQLLPRALGVPLMLNTEIAEVEGGTRVTAVHVTRNGTSQRIEADGLITTGNFRPEAHLAQLAGLELDPGTGGPMIDEGGRTSNTSIYAAGNVLRPVETAGWCWSEGRAVARVIASDLAAHPVAPRGRIDVNGDALRYVVPQYLRGGPVRAFDWLQARVLRPAQGRFGVCVGSVEQAGRDRSLLPERRLTLPLPHAPKDHVSVHLHEFGIPS